MLQISADLSVLSQAQREAIADFILSFPTSGNDPVKPNPIVSVDPSLFTAEEQAEEMTAEQAFAPVGGPSQVDPPVSPLTVPAINEYGYGIDKDGLPWDERIHASSKAKTQDGGWRMKRGVDPTLVTTVEAELKALMGLPSPGGSITVREVNEILASAGITQIPTTSSAPAPVGFVGVPSPAPFIVPPPPAAPAAAEAPSITASPVVSAPTVAAPPPPPAAPAVNPFITLVTTAGPAVTAGKITEDEVKAMCNSVGVPNLALMNNRPDLCPQVLDSVRLLIATR